MRRRGPADDAFEVTCAILVPLLTVAFWLLMALACATPGDDPYGDLALFTFVAAVTLLVMVQ
jgi:hypothetical protein